MSRSPDGRDDDDYERCERRLSSERECRQLLKTHRPRVVLHLAGVTARGNAPQVWAECVAANLLPTACLISAVASLDEDHRPALILAGSQLEYGTADRPWTERVRAQPDTAYGAAKLAATELLLGAIRGGLLRGCVVRLPIVFGPGQSSGFFVPDLIRCALRGQPFQMSDGQQQRRFLYVRDAARVLLDVAAQLAQGLTPPALINAPASKPIRVADLARDLAARIDPAVDIERGVLPRRAGETDEGGPDTGLAESLFVEPLTDFSDALGETIAWYRENDLKPEAAG